MRVHPDIIAVNDGRTRCRIDGSSEQPAILLLHGVGRSLEDWAPQHQRLAGYRTIALDIPGSVLSTRPHDSMSVPALARGRVATTLDVLGEKRAAPRHRELTGRCRGTAAAVCASRTGGKSGSGQPRRLWLRGLRNGPVGF